MTSVSSNQRYRLHVIQMLHRHGDRSPLENIYRTGSSMDSPNSSSLSRYHQEQQQLEDAYWTQELFPSTESHPLLFQLKRKKSARPIEKNVTTDELHSTGRSFGQLTQRGFKRMMQQGRLMVRHLKLLYTSCDN